MQLKRALLAVFLPLPLVLPLSLSFSLFAPAFAQSQSTPASTESLPTDYQHQLILKFDDDVVRGETDGPTMDIIETRRRPIHTSLVRVRHSFLPEMIRSSFDQ